MSRHPEFAISPIRAVLPSLRGLFRRVRRQTGVLEPESLPDYLKRDIGLADGQLSPCRHALWD